MLPILIILQGYPQNRDFYYSINPNKYNNLHFNSLQGGRGGRSQGFGIAPWVLECFQGFGIAPRVLELLPGFWSCSQGYRVKCENLSDLL